MFGKAPPVSDWRRRDAGHEVEHISLKSKEVKYCIGCLACQQTQTCVLKDDAVEIAEKVKNADTLVFVTPIYYYEMSGQIDHQKRRFFPKRIVTIVIATILVLSLSTIALATRNFWSPVLAEWFGLSKEQQEELMNLGTTTFVGQTAEDNGLTITVEQVCGR